MTFQGIYGKLYRMYKYILLDLDGTLIYSHPGIFSCFRYAMEKMGRERPTDEQLKPVVGPSLFHSFTTFFGMNEEDARRAVVLYREQYAVTGVWENLPVEGALEALKRLQEAGYILALATSKPVVYATKIVEKHGFAPYLKEIVGPSFDGDLPKKADVIAEAMKRLGVSADECLMVGDTHYDAEGAAEMDVDCVLLKIGGYEKEERLYSCGAKYVLGDFSDLLKLLQK